MGTDDNIPTYAMLETLADSGNYTAVLHVGDFAYDMESGWGKVLFFNPFQQRQILDSFKLKHFADDKLKSDENGRNVLQQGRKHCG